MSHMTETKMISFSDWLLILETEDYDTEINYLNNFV